MRYFLFLFLLATTSQLTAQSSSHVLPYWQLQTDRIIEDRTSGGFYLEGYTFNINSPVGLSALITAWDEEGELRWERVIETDSVNIPRDRDYRFSSIYDLDEDHLLYVGLPGIQCDIPVDGLLLYVLEKDSGEVLFKYLAPLEWEDGYEPGFTLSVTTSPSGGSSWVEVANRNLELLNDNGTFSVEQLPDSIHTVAMQMLSDSTVTYVNLDSPGLRFRHLPSGVETVYPYAEFADVRRLYADSSGIYLHTTNQFLHYDTSSLATTQIATLDEEYRSEGYPEFISFFRAEDEAYFRYFPAIDSLSPLRIVNSGTRLNGLFYGADDRYYLAGTHHFGGADEGNAAYGYWYKSIGDSIIVDREPQLSLLFEEPIELLSFEQDPVFFTGEYRYAVRVTNTGIVPIDSFNVNVSITTLTFCGLLSDYVNLVDLSPGQLLPGESIIVVDTFFRSANFNPSGIYNQFFQLCTGRPNGELELSPEDNCESTVIVGTNKVAKQNIQLKAFPNPTTDAWQITQLPKEALDWSLVSTHGRVVRRGKLPRGHGGQLRIGSENLPAGLYRLNVRTATPSVLSRGRADLITTETLVKQ